MAAARAKKLRDVLDENQRATARLGAIVSRTDGQLSELRQLMGPVQARTRHLSNAHKNLTAVHEETSRWLEQLEVSWSSGALLERGFEDDDSDALLACVDRLVEAEAFFSRRRAYKGAESSWRHAGDLLDKSLERCEETFARLLFVHDRAADSPPPREAEPEPTREKTTTPDAREASRDATRVSPSLAPPPPPPAPADAGALPPPPPPLVFERPPTPSTPAMLLGRLATLRTPTDGGASSSPSSFRTPSTPSAATPRTPSLSARRAEARRASFFDVSPALRRVARILVDAPYARRDTRGNAIRAYVTTRDAASAASLEARGLEMASEGRRGGAPAGLGDGADATRLVKRWLAALDAAVANWPAEERLACEVFGEDIDGAVVSAATPEILERSAERTARRWAETFAAGAAPEKVFALLRAEAALTRLRWGLETTSRARVHAGALRAWREATRIVARGARDAKDATLPTVAREAARCRASLAARCAKDGGEADAAREAAAFARGVAGFAARLAATPGAAEALFGEEAEEASEEASSEEASSDGADSDGILDFSDEEEESSGGAPSATTKKEKKKKKETTTTTTTKTKTSPPRTPISPPARSAADDRFASFLASVVATASSCAAREPSEAGPAPAKPPPASRSRRSGASVSSSSSAAAGGGGGASLLPALAAALRAAALDEAVSAARESPDLHAALGDAFWSRRVEVMEAECAEAFVDAAWGAGLEATRPKGAPDPAAMSDKQRQLVKDRFAAVNAAADAWAGAASGIHRATRGREALRERLRRAVRDAVGEAYRAFHARFANSGFARKHPEKYVRFTPDAMETALEAPFLQ